jgi:hypothetical protein
MGTTASDPAMGVWPPAAWAGVECLANPPGVPVENGARQGVARQLGGIPSGGWSQVLPGRHTFWGGASFPVGVVLAPLWGVRGRHLPLGCVPGGVEAGTVLAA